MIELAIILSICIVGVALFVSLSKKIWKARTGIERTLNARIDEVLKINADLATLKTQHDALASGLSHIAYKLTQIEDAEKDAALRLRGNLSELKESISAHDNNIEALVLALNARPPGSPELDPEALKAAERERARRDWASKNATKA